MQPRFTDMSSRIAILFPALLGGGGAECVCVWMVQALAREHHVSLVTLIPVDLADLDRRYGTEIAQMPVSIRGAVPRLGVPVLGRIFGRYSRHVKGFRQHLLMRRFAAMRHEFDVCISAYNEMDLGGSGIQYMHDPPGSRVGGAVLKRFSGYDESRALANVGLTPSAWLFQRYSRAYPGFEGRVVYPPVRSSFPRKAWTDRDDAFVCVARLSAEKKVDEAVDIVSRVRSRGFDVRLRILSGGGRWPYDSRIRRIARENSSWMSLYSDLTDREYRGILSSSKFGINACAEEGFGIATAELINAGCLPFVRTTTSGQSEIGNINDAITFDTVPEAVSRISVALRSRADPSELIPELSLQARRFSTDRFMREIADVVDSVLEDQVWAERAGRDRS